MIFVMMKIMIMPMKIIFILIVLLSYDNNFHELFEFDTVKYSQDYWYFSHLLFYFFYIGYMNNCYLPLTFLNALPLYCYPCNSLLRVLLNWLSSYLDDTAYITNLKEAVCVFQHHIFI